MTLRPALFLAETNDRPSSATAPQWSEPEWEDVAPGISCKLLASDTGHDRADQRWRWPMMSVEHEVRVLIAEKLGLQEEDIAGDASIVDDLGADSLDTVEMVIAIEGKFGLAVPDEEAMQIGTVRQAVEYISRAIENRP